MKMSIQGTTETLKREMMTETTVKFIDEKMEETTTKYMATSVINHMSDVMWKSMKERQSKNMANGRCFNVRIGLKKCAAILMVIALFMTFFVTEVRALNDAQDLGYRLNITIVDADNMAADTFQIGETIKLKLSLSYIGTGKAPLYGLQGRLNFDPYVIRTLELKEKNGVALKEGNGQITYLFLDMEGLGKDDKMMENIGEVTFIAKSNGTVGIYCDSLLITNKDASLRYADSSAAINLKIGTGVKDVTKELLEADIDAAERMLSDCPVTDIANPGIYYPDFWITSQTELTFRNAIEKAKAVYLKDGATEEEIELAVSELNGAVKIFEASRIIGLKRWPVDSYVVVVAKVESENGKIHPDFKIQNCRLNTSCTIRFLPDEGYETEYVYIDGEKFLGSDIFTIPNVSHDTTIKVTFCKKPPFVDISHDDWFYEGVRYCYNKSLFRGTAENEFSPSMPMSRAMLVTVLYRLEGEPEYDGITKNELDNTLHNIFNDIENGRWYSDAVKWASKNNIVKGYGGGIFGPDDDITREQVTVILYRYAMGKGLIHNVSEIPSYYSDITEISDYAIDAMTWAISEGIIRGNTETTINPKGNTTRAEVATILMRYLGMLGEK